MTPMGTGTLLQIQRVLEGHDRRTQRQKQKCMFGAYDAQESTVKLSSAASSLYFDAAVDLRGLRSSCIYSESVRI